MRRRVVVTGLGLVTPVGNDVPSAWQALLAGKSGGAPITLYDPTGHPVRFAAEVKGWDPELWMDRKEVKRTDRFCQFAIGAAVQAFKDSGLETYGDLDPDLFGVITGSGIGGITTLEDQHKKLLDRGPDRVSPFFIPMFIPDMAPGLISMRFNAKGPNYTTISACASSAHAIGLAFRSIRDAEADVMLTGGAESTVTPLTLAGFASMKALSERNDSPETASRPFDRTRDGFVLGEGAGMLVLEALEHAQRRGAKIYAEIIGFGQSADAYHMTAPAPEGEGAQRCMRAALLDGDIEPTEVDYINAHGTSTPLNDKSETDAVKKVFGDWAYKLVMGSTKSMTGHTLGAAGGVELAITCLAAQHGKMPPTINFSESDPDCDLEYGHNRVLERKIRVALSNSFGFGGHNVTLAVRRWDGK